MTARAKAPTTAKRAKAKAPPARGAKPSAAAKASRTVATRAAKSAPARAAKSAPSRAAKSAPRAGTLRDGVTFFASFADWHAWLAANHATAGEFWVGFHKRHTGMPSLTWPQSVDGALCFGWIDGVRYRIDDLAYKIRFTPRKPASTWSAINIRRMAELRALDLMHPAGEAAFARRTDARSAIYAYEKRPADLPEPWLGQLKRNKPAWAFFSSQAPWYRRTATHWVISAKREETKAKRFARLVADSAQGLRIGPLRRDERAEAKSA